MGTKTGIDYSAFAIPKPGKKVKKEKGIKPELREKIYNKYNHACADCLKRENLEIHHIQVRGMGGRKNADRENNLILLCRDCHQHAHHL